MYQTSKRILKTNNVHYLYHSVTLFGLFVILSCLTGGVSTVWLKGGMALLYLLTLFVQPDLWSVSDDHSVLLALLYLTSLVCEVGL